MFLFLLFLHGTLGGMIGLSDLSQTALDEICPRGRWARASSAWETQFTGFSLVDFFNPEACHPTPIDWKICLEKLWNAALFNQEHVLIRVLDSLFKTENAFHFVGMNGVGKTRATEVISRALLYDEANLLVLAGQKYQREFTPEELHKSMMEISAQVEKRLTSCGYSIIIIREAKLINIAMFARLHGLVKTWKSKYPNALFVFESDYAGQAIWQLSQEAAANLSHVQAIIHKSIVDAVSDEHAQALDIVAFNFCTDQLQLQLLEHLFEKWQNTKTYDEYFRSRRFVSKLTISPENMQRWLDTQAHRQHRSCYRATRDAFDEMTGYFLAKQMNESLWKKGDIFQRIEYEAIYGGPGEQVQFKALPRS